MDLMPTRSKILFCSTYLDKTCNELRIWLSRRIQILIWKEFTVWIRVPGGYSDSPQNRSFWAHFNDDDMSPFILRPHNILYPTPSHHILYPTRYHHILYSTPYHILYPTPYHHIFNQPLIIIFLPNPLSSYLHMIYVLLDSGWLTWLPTWRRHRWS